MNNKQYLRTLVWGQETNRNNMGNQSYDANSSRGEEVKKLYKDIFIPVYEIVL